MNITSTFYAIFVDKNSIFTSTKTVHHLLYFLSFLILEAPMRKIMTVQSNMLYKEVIKILFFF